MNKRYNITIAILLFVAVILISSINTPEKDYHEEIKDVSLTFSNEKYQKISLDYDNKQLKYEIKKEVKKKEESQYYNLVIEKDKGVSSVSYTKAKCYKNNDNCTLLLPSFIINDSYKLDGIFLNKERVEKNNIELNKDSILEIRTVKISKI